jgi:hypothetical protein
VDKRALKILLNSFWSHEGWKPRAERGPAPDDFAYAKSKGMMFDTVRLDHAQVLQQLLTAVNRLDRRRVTDAFLASLSTRRLDWRSALGSYAVFQRLSLHAAVESDHRCTVCGLYTSAKEQDLNVLNFERYKWGGVRHDQVVYAAFDLNLFLDGEPPKPTTEDLQSFRALIAAIAAVDPDVTSAGLHTHFAKVLKSNKAERDAVVAILGFCGILGTPEHPGFSDAFVAVTERRVPDRRFVDMPYPACWWQGSVGLDRSRLAEYFGYAL